MILVKLIVLIGCINRFCACQTNYCKICLNHTLCKYNIPGPSVACKSYDNTALLTNQDISQLVNKINERRNFVAMGYSKILPQAANMKKIRWSAELAIFAQRWVDQCVSAIHPDTEDLCRDLENAKVGQVISSVVGPSTRLNVKSFVEMWFIQILNYAGSVSYYNQSRDYRTSSFTQLIWANTETVGCGKAKFYVDERNVMLERLVCNFSPKGNVHGKPIYSIGFAATQCLDEMSQDNEFKGLCDYEDHNTITILTTQQHPENSLLRILNLSNNSVKHEIDPIRNNLKQTVVNSSSNNEKRNQKIRHIFLNNSYAPGRRNMPIRKHTVWKSVINMTRNNDNDYHYQRERGHSHLYHGHESPPIINYPITSELNFNSKQDFRKYDYTTQLVNYVSNSNFRKNDQNAQCTRRWPLIENNNCYTNNQCTKRADDCCQQTTKCPQLCSEIPFTNPVDICSCTIQACPTFSTNCNCDMNCQYPSTPHTCLTTTNCPTTCREMHCNGCRKSGSFQNYDMIPNVVVRSGNHRPQVNVSPKKDPWLFDNLKINHSYKKKYDGFDPSQKDKTDYSKYNTQDSDYIYQAYDSRLRKRRQLNDQITLIPFWQIETSYKKPSQLKSIRYTTLANNNRKTRRNMVLAKWLASTEPITLNVADYVDNQEHITEKFLSFDELMHLRKINDRYAQYDFRRQEETKVTKSKLTKTKLTKTKMTKTKMTKTKKDNSTKTKKETKSKTTKTTKEKTTEKVDAPKNDADALDEDTTEYTVNTPFERKKHCTRKLTCTWTAFSVNDDGDVRGMVEIGSRTPLGYVEGCTRTSTCTRDYLDRNKIATGTDDSSSDSTSGDEDYCERKSLNVQKRNSDIREEPSYVFSHQTYTTFPIITLELSTYNTNPNIETRDVTKNGIDTHDCICNKNNARKKRQEVPNPKEIVLSGDKQCDDSKNSFSYGELYYMILNKILKSKREKQLYTNECPCNSSRSADIITLLFLLIYLTCIFNVCM